MYVEEKVREKNQSCAKVQDYIYNHGQIFLSVKESSILINNYLYVIYLFINIYSSVGRPNWLGSLSSK